MNGVDETSLAHAIQRAENAEESATAWWEAWAAEENRATTAEAKAKDYWHMTDKLARAIKRAENAEARSASWLEIAKNQTRAYHQARAAMWAAETRADKAESDALQVAARASSWWEIAKDAVRERDGWHGWHETR